MRMITFKWIMAALLLCGTLQADHVNSPASDWKELREKNLSMGFSRERIDRTIAGCRSNGVSVQDAENLLAPVYSAHMENLPTDCLLIKVEEGLAKGVAWKEVCAAADKRLECTRKADELILSVRERRGAQHQHLVQHLCLAMECGLPQEVLKDVINRPSPFRYGRMIHVIEAGESLHLAGLDPEQTRLIMNDCLDRELTCAEIMRVIDVFQNGLREGKDFSTLHSTLWNSSEIPGSRN